MSVIRLDVLFELPDAYKALGPYQLSVDQIKELGTQPPYRPCGFNRKVEVVPYIKTHDGRDIVLPDIEKNHNGLQTLGEMFAANQYLYNVENLPEGTALSKDDRKNVRLARKIVRNFEKQYVEPQASANLAFTPKFS